MSDFCGLKFQSFPTEIRLQIYGILLVNYDANEEYQRLHSDNDEAHSSTLAHLDSLTENSYLTDTDSDDDGDRVIELVDDGGEHDQGYSEEWNEESGALLARGSVGLEAPLFIVNRSQDGFARKSLWRSCTLHPMILRASREIHREAAPVLYGENIFAWRVAGTASRRLWYTNRSDKPELPQNYTRLITKLWLRVDVINATWLDFDMGKARMSTRKKLRRFCTQLRVNNMRKLKVNYCWYLPHCGHGTPGEPEHALRNKQECCLEALKHIRATEVSQVMDSFHAQIKANLRTQFSISDRVSSTRRSALKATIEGPRNLCP